MREGYGICPVCNGTGKRAAGNTPYKEVYAGYDKETDSLPCTNCGGQRMFGTPTGEVQLRKDGSPCMHEYRRESLGRCYTAYSCIHCEDSYSIDSSD